MISVIIGHYDLAKHLPATLAHVLEQTYGNIEISIVDDHSTEETSRDVVDTMNKRQRRMSVHIPAEKIRKEVPPESIPDLREKRPRNVF